jgi:hypothetical protein
MLSCKYANRKAKKRFANNFDGDQNSRLKAPVVCSFLTVLLLGTLVMIRDTLVLTKSLRHKQ